MIKEMSSRREKKTGALADRGGRERLFFRIHKKS